VRVVVAEHDAPRLQRLAEERLGFFEPSARALELDARRGLAAR
jgi:hypothetical protein